MFNGNIRRIATVVTAKDNATSSLEDAERAGDDTTESLEDLEEQSDDTSDSFVEIDAAAAAAGAAIAGVGAAAQRTMDQTRGLRESLTITEGTIGDTEGNLTALATSLSDATFETGEVVQTFEQLRQVGVDTEEQMEFLAVELDLIGDATGQAASELASNLIPTLNAYGEDLENVAEMQDTLAYTMNSTQMDARSLNRMLTRQQDEFEEMGLGVEESVQLLGAYQEETGLSGRTLRREFRQDIEQANGDIGRFADEVGMSADALEEFEDDIPEDFAEDLADDVADTTTLMDEMRVVVSDTQLRFSEFLQPVSAVGPALKMAGSAALIYGQVQWSTAIPATRAKAAALWTKISALSASTAAYARNIPAMLASASVAGIATGALGALSTAKLIAAGAATTLWTALGPIGLAVLGITAAVMGLVAIWRTDFLGAGDAAGSVLGWFGDRVDSVRTTVSLLTELLWQLGRVFLMIGAVITLGPIIAFLKFFEDPQRWLSAGESAGRNLLGAISDFLSPRRWIDMGSDAASGLISGLVDNIVPDPVTDAVSDVASGARDMLPFSDAREGPLSDLTSSGAALVETLGQGVQDSGGIAGALGGAAGGAMDALGIDTGGGDGDSGGSTNITFNQTINFDGASDDDDVRESIAEATEEGALEVLERKLMSDMGA